MASEKRCPSNTFTPEAEVVKVIRVISQRGCGRSECCAIRTVTTYWTEDGKKIAEHDSIEGIKSS